ncbi:hypothetical protein PYI85_12130 [Staphylococcus warneri]|uniref:hypothetical protein n=1 Tax=Staphylococcus warneri TaxID=1292 RepID=UPI002480D30F|nr:hypothetical protein [Staphylococcus warneri]MDH8806184.1 hypothetical protein [Staphylococcus warneri]MDH8809297.1 hypothetical protein [Staphylococcus warneri]MDH8839282.1 hypothetical protein [Staphylococcus warneri]MDH8844458.1 hypothetical protein [Staphylococcus warneri]MDH8849194.1 hypothetical protein [Staphylococcus warneri]
MLKLYYKFNFATEPQKANGAGGGGSSWAYADENESFNDWKARTDKEKAEAGY